ncbi:TPA: HAD-IIA family hydrolase [Candidatus Micrarchaeota archaeon]|nr:HAD-IIA family hydrolase [Candidatus Micrarchaeota archaeon]HIH29860.1 HAD-IIA family hydrolase [Candidatus Micrarchaeota archaeon]
MVQAIVFDMDGVLYRGSRKIMGVPEEISRLQEKVAVLFLTNNATKSRSDYVKWLAIFGIRASESEIMTSSFGCAHYIREKHGLKRKVFVIGEQGLKDELMLEAKARIVEGKGAKIVVCGLDRGITYKKYENAMENLSSGAAFMLANSDPTLPKERGFAPGSGAIASVLITATGRKPDVTIGKPSTYLIDKLLQMHKLKPQEAAFVGDRLEIDMRMANAVGMKSVLVLSGVAKRKDVKNAPASDKPDIILSSAAKVGQALGI